MKMHSRFGAMAAAWVALAACVSAQVPGKKETKGNMEGIMVTVTPANGPAVTGTLIASDDFTIALRDSSGQYHSFKRMPSLKVEKKDPLQAHIDLLPKYTDKNMHDIVAYLETLK